MEKLKTSSDCRSYYDRLQPAEKSRYAQKLLSIDGNDPYEIPDHSWSKNPDDVPDLTYIDMVNYFIDGKSPYTKESFKNHKSMKSYKIFMDGWVRDVRCYRPKGCANVVQANVCTFHLFVT